LATVPVFAAWRLHYLRQRSRWKRFEEAVDLVSGSGSGTAALELLSKDASLESLRNRMERLIGVRDSMVQRIEHEEFSLRAVLSCMEEGVLVAADPTDDPFGESGVCEDFCRWREGVWGVRFWRCWENRRFTGCCRRPWKAGLANSSKWRWCRGSGETCVDSFTAVQNERDVKGRPGVLAVFRDVTRLQELENVRREFVANVSHELRTPLRA